MATTTIGVCKTMLINFMKDYNFFRQYGGNKSLMRVFYYFEHSGLVIKIKKKTYTTCCSNLLHACLFRTKPTKFKLESIDHHSNHLLFFVSTFTACQFNHSLVWCGKSNDFELNQSKRLDWSSQYFGQFSIKIVPNITLSFYFRFTFF